MQTADVARVLEAARAEAAKVGKPVTLCVLNVAGVALGLERVGDPGTFTSIVADGKANGALTMGRDSSQLAAMAERAPAIVNAMITRTGGRFVAVAGGVLIQQGGAVVGAIGVSGATAEEDEQIAQAGAKALA
ncbi:MAG: heme-binding protein [Dehalococcoidia bacterium]